VEIRRARVEDAAPLARVHVATWQAAYEHVFGAERLAAVGAERRVQVWERSLREPAAHDAVFVAEVEDAGLVGFASVGSCRDGPDTPGGELYALYVLPEAWGSGAGSALLAAGMTALRGAGYDEAILWVLEDNPRARRFYEREGWRPDGGRRTGEHLGVRTVEVRYRIAL